MRKNKASCGEHEIARQAGDAVSLMKRVLTSAVIEKLNEVSQA